MSWSNSYSHNLSSNLSSIPNHRPYGKINEDSTDVHIFHILNLPENLNLSVEELRLKSRRGNSYASNYSNFGQGSITPNKYSYLSGASKGLSTGLSSNNPFASNNASNNGIANFNQNNPFGNTNAGLAQGNSYNTQSNPFNNSNLSQSSPFGPQNTNLGQSNFYRNLSNPNDTMNASSNYSFYSQNNALSQSNPFSAQNNNISGINNNISGMGGLSNPFSGPNNQFSSQNNPFSTGFNSGSNAFAGKSQLNSTGNYANPFNVQGSNSANFGSGQNFNNASGGFFSSTPNLANNQVGGNVNGNSFFAQTPGFLASNPQNPGIHSNNQNSGFPSFTSQSFNFSSNPAGLNFSNSHPVPNAFYSQPLYSQNISQFSNPNSYSFQDLHSQSLSQRPLLPSSFFKDPYGLSWIFPDQDPEELLRNFKPKDPKPVNLSVSQRILGSKASDKFLEKKTPSYVVKPKLFKRPQKPLTFDFPVREKFKDIQYEFIEDNGVKYMKKIEEISEKIDFVAYIKGDKEVKVNLSVNPGNTILEIKDSIMKTLNKVQDFNLKRGEKILQTFETVFEAGIKTGDNLIIEFIEDIWPTLDMLPQSKYFRIFPSIEQMAKMTIDELKNVENLVLENENGKIVFEDKIDVLGLDFDKLLKIDPKSFEGFPDSSMADKLNKPALVHLYNIKPGKYPGKMEVHLRVSCEEQGTEFIKYDPVKEEFIFRILHI